MGKNEEIQRFELKKNESQSKLILLLKIITNISIVLKKELRVIIIKQKLRLKYI